MANTTTHLVLPPVSDCVQHAGPALVIPVPRSMWMPGAEAFKYTARDSTRSAHDERDIADLCVALPARLLMDADTVACDDPGAVQAYVVAVPEDFGFSGNKLTRDTDIRTFLFVICMRDKDVLESIAARYSDFLDMLLKENQRTAQARAAAQEERPDIMSSLDAARLCRFLAQEQTDNVFGAFESHVIWPKYASHNVALVPPLFAGGIHVTSAGLRVDAAVAATGAVCRVPLECMRNYGLVRACFPGVVGRSAARTASLSQVGGVAADLPATIVLRGPSQRIVVQAIQATTRRYLAFPGTTPGNLQAAEDRLQHLTLARFIETMGRVRVEAEQIRDVLRDNNVHPYDVVPEFDDLDSGVSSLFASTANYLATLGVMDTGLSLLLMCVGMTSLNYGPGRQCNVILFGSAGTSKSYTVKIGMWLLLQCMIVPLAAITAAAFSRMKSMNGVYVFDEVPGALIKQGGKNGADVNDLLQLFKIATTGEATRRIIVTERADGAKVVQTLEMECTASFITCSNQAKDEFAGPVVDRSVPINAHSQKSDRDRTAAHLMAAATPHLQSATPPLQILAIRSIGAAVAEVMANVDRGLYPPPCAAILMWLTNVLMKYIPKQVRLLTQVKELATMVMLYDVVFVVQRLVDKGFISPDMRDVYIASSLILDVQHVLAVLPPMVEADPYADAYIRGAIDMVLGRTPSQLDVDGCSFHRIVCANLRREFEETYVLPKTGSPEFVRSGAASVARMTVTTGDKTHPLIQLDWRNNALHVHPQAIRMFPSPVLRRWLEWTELLYARSQAHFPQGPIFAVNDSNEFVIRAEWMVRAGPAHRGARPGDMRDITRAHRLFEGLARSLSPSDEQLVRTKGRETAELSLGKTTITVCDLTGNAMLTSEADAPSPEDCASAIREATMGGRLVVKTDKNNRPVVWTLQRLLVSERADSPSAHATKMQAVAEDCAHAGSPAGLHAILSTDPRTGKLLTINLPVSTKPVVLRNPMLQSGPVLTLPAGAKRKADEMSMAGGFMPATTEYVTSYNFVDDMCQFRASKLYGEFVALPQPGEPTKVFSIRTARKLLRKPRDAEMEEDEQSDTMDDDTAARSTTPVPKEPATIVELLLENLSAASVRRD